ncbi:radical SAM/SPASM domain-containing protein [Streptomyces sp. NEAU-174]|uniref:radical SAM/SPASM domain-containing protein n=1 Tax=Streptomyces sp. NEAU-174 TaxID=3458254 RepID=UPI004044C1E5
MNQRALVMLVSGTCPPDCLVCRRGDKQKSSANSLDLSTLDGYDPQQHDEVYVGVEAFSDPEQLALVLDACQRRGIAPILVTRGQWLTSRQEGTHFLKSLLQHGPFRIMLALDHSHFQALGPTRVDEFLTAAKRAFLTPPEILYFLRDGERLPDSLLSCEAVNKFTTLHTTSFPSLEELLSTSAQPPTTGGARSVSAVADSVAAHDEKKQYPLRFNALVLETTHFCNARCTHCYTSCGPESPRDRLSVQQVRQIIDEAASLPNLTKHCHIGGGEATIYWDDLVCMLDHAQSKGFRNSIVTNGFWGRTQKLATRKVAELKSVGVERIEFSVDAMHQAFVSPAAISNIIRAGKDTGVRIMLRVSTTKTHRTADVMKSVDTDAQADIIIASAKVVPVGRAREEIPIDDVWTDAGIPIGACFELLNLTVTPNGDVFPCCAGSEVCPSLKLGNCLEQSLPEIMGASRGNFLVRTLVHTGPAYYAALIREAGLGDKLPDRFANFCHLCNHIFTDEDLSKFVRKSINDKVGHVLEKMAAQGS